MMLRCLHRFALIATVFITQARALLPARGQMLVHDPSNYAQNVPPSRPRAAADQQPDHGLAEPDSDTVQPGQKPGETSVFFPAGDRAVDRENPAAAPAG